MLGNSPATADPPNPSLALLRVAMQATSMGLLLVHFGAFLDDLESAARAKMNDVFSFSFSASAS